MKKNEIAVKKKKKIWKTVCLFLFCSAMLAVVGLMYMEIRKLTNQIAFMQDTTSIILSDVNGMQADIEKTLREEASMVESYSIDIVDMDFLRKTYQVEVSAVPKEYTEKTKMSIFFGTTECPLKLQGYVYQGSLNLPLDKTFDGNITFLLANGKKKSTEVIEDYDGLQTHLEDVLFVAMEDTPSCKAGTLKLDSTGNLKLNGFGRYEFDELKLVAQVDEEEIQEQDLLENMQEEKTEGLITTETVETVGSALPVTDYDGEIKCDFSCELETPQTDHGIRVFVRAVSTEGYRFEYDLFRGNYSGSEENMDEESIDRTSHCTVYDRKGGKIEF